MVKSVKQQKEDQKVAAPLNETGINLIKYLYHLYL